MTRSELLVELARLRPDDRPSRAEITQARRCLRNAEILKLAATHYVDKGSGRAMAAAIELDICRYAASSWRLDRARPADTDTSRRAGWWRILDLNDGAPIDGETVRRVLAGRGSPGSLHLPHPIKDSDYRRTGL